MQTQLAQELNSFSPEQRRHIYDNVFAVQLTQGCSLGCDFCGFDVGRGVEGQIPFSVLEQIAEEMTVLTDRTTDEANNFSFVRHPNRLYLLDESDPLDYEYNGKNYFDAKELFASRGFAISTTTAIPKGKEELAIENLDKITRISISHMNRKRLEPYFEDLGVVIYIDLASYYHVQYGRIPKFGETPITPQQFKVEGTVRETIAQLRKKDPSLPTKTRYYDQRTDRNKPHEEVQDPNTLVLWCGRDEFPPRDGRILDMDEGGLHTYGRAFDMPPYEIDSWRERKPYCSIAGVKITPEGIFNVLSVNHSDKHKTGRIIERVSPDNFNVLELQNLKHLPLVPEIGFYHYAELGAA